MLNKTLKISAAVMFGAMLGSSTAIAQDEEVRTGFLRVFAKETLLANDKATYDGIEYYGMRGNPSTFRRYIRPDYDKPSNGEIIMTYELDGAVFFGRKDINIDMSTGGQDANKGTFDIERVSGTCGVDNGSGFGTSVLTRETLSGGRGDSRHVFRFSGSAAWGSDACMRLGFHPIGLPVDSEASLRVTFMNREFINILDPKVLVWEDTFRTRQALTEEAEPRDLLTSENLRTFVDGQMAASVGSITLSVAHPDPEGEETHEQREMATSESDDGIHFFRVHSSPERVKNVTHLIGIGDSKEDGSYFTFDGDFSFASKVTVDKSAECDGEDLPDLLSRDEDDNVTDTSSVTWLVKQDNVTTTRGFDLEGPPIHLCIHVDGEKPIPSTGPYMVTTTYAKAVADQGETAFAAEGGEHMLGSIERGGTTVHIPWITTQDRYNQRLTIVNRGPEAGYKFTFRPDDETTARLLSEGSLPEETSLVLKVRDLVEIDGSSNDISAELQVYGKSDDIDVSSTQVNLDTGDSDTVVYQ